MGAALQGQENGRTGSSAPTTLIGNTFCRGRRLCRPLPIAGSGNGAKRVPNCRAGPACPAVCGCGAGRRHTWVPPYRGRKTGGQRRPPLQHLSGIRSVGGGDSAGPMRGASGTPPPTECAAGSIQKGSLSCARQGAFLYQGINNILPGPTAAGWEAAAAPGMPAYTAATGPQNHRPW